MSTRHLPNARPLADDWRSLGSCSDVDDAEIFFPVGAPDSDAYLDVADQARAICATCPVPVRDQCGAYALEHRLTGIWAGLDDRGRDTIRRSQAQPRQPAEVLAARPNSVERRARHAVIRRLHAAGATVAEMAEHCQTTTRTIERDLHDLGLARRTVAA